MLDLGKKISSPELMIIMSNWNEWAPGGEWEVQLRQLEATKYERSSDSRGGRDGQKNHSGSEN